MIEILRGTKIAIDRKKVFRYLGYKEEETFPKLAFIDDILALAEKLIVPEVFYTVSPIKSVREDEVVFENKFVVEGSFLPRRLRKNARGMFYLATIGIKAEHHISKFLRDGLYTEAMILDSTCWVALQEVVKFLKMTVPDGKVDCSLVPGFRNLPLKKQKEIFRLFTRKKTGITLTREHMLVPKKTLSGIVLFHEKG